MTQRLLPICNANSTMQVIATINSFKTRCHTLDIILSISINCHIYPAWKISVFTNFKKQWWSPCWTSSTKFLKISIKFVNLISLAPISLFELFSNFFSYTMVKISSQLVQPWWLYLAWQTDRNDGSISPDSC